MRIEVRLPSGLEITFEGEEEAFDSFKSFLSALPGFVENLGTGRAAVAAGPASRELPTGGGESMDAATLSERLSRVGANTDIERVTVMSQAAIESGLSGLDYSTTDRLYTELALRKPKQWKATFSNAKQRGLIQSVGQGLWKPTVPGENFARYGTPPTTPKKRAPVRKQR